jgi:hypothetical protein
VVAGADRNHAVSLLLAAEAAHLVQRAAGLERTGALEQLALEPCAQRAAREERRRMEAIGDRLACAYDIVAGR